MGNIINISPTIYNKPMKTLAHQEDDSHIINRGSGTDAGSLPIIGVSPTERPEIHPVLSPLPGTNDWLGLDNIRFLPLERYKDGQPKKWVLAKDTVFIIRGLKYTIKARSEMIVDRNGTIEGITPSSNLTINGVEYLAEFPIGFYENGNVKDGRLAKPFKGELDYPAGWPVEFDRNGMLLEGTWNCFRQLFPNIKLSGELEKTPEHVILSTIEALLATTDDMRDSLEGIELTNKVKSDCKDPRAIGCAILESSLIKLGIGAHELQTSSYQGTVYHELAHLLTNRLRRQNSSFSQEWKKVADANIYHYIIFSEADLDLPNDNNPFKGCINKYGTRDSYEDAATFTEKAATDPTYIAQLLDKNSPNYDPRYPAKLELLRKYHFISERQYQVVIELSRTPFSVL